MSQDPLSAWYADFFTELPNAFWRAAVPPEMTASDVDFVVRVAGLLPGAHVLDVPCGSGRHTLELARRGFTATGLDVSAEALAFARRTADAERLAVTLCRADMSALSAALPTGTRADAALCLGNSFGYLDHEANRTLLSDLHGLIDPGGCLVIDYGAVAEGLLPHFPDTLPMSAGGIDMEATNVYDPLWGRVLTDFAFRRGTEEHRGAAVQHVYTAAEVARMARRAGFTDVEMYGDTDGAPFTLGTRLLLVARRPQ